MCINSSGDNGSSFICDLSHTSWSLPFVSCRFAFWGICQCSFAVSLERDAQLKELLHGFNHTDKDLHGAPVGSTAFTVIILQK